MDMKYSEHGQEYKVIEKVTGGYLVQAMYEDYEGEIGLEPTQFFSGKLLDKPPVQKMHTEIVSLEKDIESLMGERNLIRDDLRRIEKEREEKADKLKQNEQLKTLFDFIDGKIKYYVTGVRYGTPEIIEFKESKDEYSRDELKLLTLFGKSNGNLNWKLNTYRDGSGCNSTAIPCLDYESAIKYLQDIWLPKQMEKNGTSSEVIKISKKFNLNISPDYIQKHREEVKNTLRINAEEYRKKQGEAEKAHREYKV